MKINIQVELRHVRSLAVSALKYCGDSKAPTLVLPLATEDTHLDPRDDIRGNALALLWPDHISATELFPLLTPSAEFYFGSYAMFKMTLPETLKTSDPLPALEWATQATSLPAGFIVQPVILECHVPESPLAAARAKGVEPPS